MNERKKSHDHSTNEQPSPLEQQLKQMRPRAARVDLSFLKQPTETTLQAAKSSTTQVGMTRVQFATAIAASWLLGAIVGGACIFLTITKNAPAMAQNVSARSGDDAEDDADQLVNRDGGASRHNETSVQNSEPSELPTGAVQASNQLSNARSIESSLRNPGASARVSQNEWLLEWDSTLAWIETPLTVRGPSQRSPASVVPEHFVTTSANHDTSSRPFTPTSQSSRAQLMQEILSEPSFKIH